MEDFKHIKTYEDALKALGREDFSHENLYPREIARRKLDIVIEALNQGWKPDWEDDSQEKWFPSFFGSYAGFGFSLSLLSPKFAYAYVGVRLCCKSEEIANYVGTQFFNLHKEMLLG